jgi:hypothetical protein
VVDGPQPGVDPAVEPAVGKVLVHVVVGDIAGNDQSECRHVQHRGVVAVAVADLDRVQPVPFQGQTVGRARLGNHARVRNLTGEQLVPACLGGPVVEACMSRIVPSVA